MRGVKHRIAVVGLWLCMAWGATPAQSSPERFAYRFDQPEFIVSHIEIDLDGGGRGRMIYTKKGDEDKNDVSVTLRPETLARLRKLLATLDFVNSSDTYQSTLTNTNIGTTELTVEQDGKKRSLTFTYSPNATLRETANLFRGLVAQHEFLTMIATARRFQPLDTPKRLIDLENDLKAGRIAEPPTLLAMLKGLSEDERVPLIARNHARRLAEKIEKDSKR